MPDSKKVPELRFREFNVEWEKKDFEDVFSILSNNTLSRAELNYDTGRIKNIHYGDILVKFASFIDASNTTLPFINNGIDVKCSLLQNGDVVIADTAEDFTAGKCTEITNIQECKLVSGLHTIPCRAVQDFAPMYLGYYMNSEEYHSQLIPHMQGTKVTSISKSALKKTTIGYPCIEEQAAVAQYFNWLDNILEINAKKLSQLQALKKSMLEKMFPKDGALVPEIRFKGFSGEWERKKLGDISLSYSGGTPAVDVAEYYNGSIPFIRSGEISKDTTEIYISQSGFENSSAKMVEKGDILYALYGATSGEVSRSKITGAINQAILAILPSEGYEANYIAQWLRNRKHIIVETYLQGGQGNLSAAIVKSLEIEVPTLGEQKAIGSFFEGVDEVISICENKLSKLQNLKSALLEKMFVG